MASAPVEPNGASTEASFRPSTLFRDSHRNIYRDSHRNRRGYLPEGCTEVELLPGLTVENIRATRIIWDAFHSFARQKIVWMTPDVYVCHDYSQVGDPLVLVLVECDAGTRLLCVHATPDTADGAATATCDFLVRLLATSEEHNLFIRGRYVTSEEHNLFIRGRYNSVSPPLSGACLSLFFQESRSCLRQVRLNRMVLSEDQCLVIATMSRLDVEVNISD
jgi:hypothetical protein